MLLIAGIISATSNIRGSVTGFAKTGDVILTNEVQSGNGYLKVVSNQTGGTPQVGPINGEIAIAVPFGVYKFLGERLCSWKRPLLTCMFAMGWPV